jgi:hypothetical protein
LALSGAGNPNGKLVFGEPTLIDAVDIEGRIRHREIEPVDTLEGVFVIGIGFLDLAGEAVDGEVHLGKAQGLAGLLDAE